MNFQENSDSLSSSTTILLYLVQAFHPVSTAIGRIIAQEIHNGFLWPGHARFELLTFTTKYSMLVIANSKAKLYVMITLCIHQK